jgi:hypothetical protein
LAVVALEQTQGRKEQTVLTLFFQQLLVLVVVLVEQTEAQQVTKMEIMVAPEVVHLIMRQLETLVLVRLDRAMVAEQFKQTWLATGTAAVVVVLAVLGQTVQHRLVVRGLIAQ